MKRVFVARFAIVTSLSLTLFLAGSGIATAQPMSKKNDALFIQLVRKDSNDFDRVSKKEIIKTAKKGCKKLRTGSSIEDLAAAALKGGVSEAGASSLIAGAIVFYCPEQSYLLE